MPVHRKLSDDQLDEMCELRESGWAGRRLADRYNVTSSAIRYQCLKLGAFSPRQIRHAQNRVDRRTGKIRSGFSNHARTFSPDEDAELLRLESEGHSIPAIGRALGRANTSVRIRLLSLARDQAIEEMA